MSERPLSAALTQHMGLVDALMYMVRCSTIEKQQEMREAIERSFTEASAQPEPKAWRCELHGILLLTGDRGVAARWREKGYKVEALAVVSE